MTTYIVTESNRKDNLLLRTWVCLTEEKAKECLKKRYDIACAYNRIAGVADPTDCLEYDFFFWDLLDGQEYKYAIIKSETFEN